MPARVTNNKHGRRHTKISVTQALKPQKDMVRSFLHQTPIEMTD